MNRANRRNVLLILGVLVLAMGGLLTKKWLKKPDERSLTNKKSTRGDQAKNEETRRDLADLAGGRKVRLVWVESPSISKPDIFARGDKLHLGTFDSQAGGYRRLTKKSGNYSRPIITPDGQHVLYTDNPQTKNGQPVAWNPRIHAVAWGGGEHRELRSGFCVDSLVDPATNKIWIYALSTLNSHNKMALDGETLIRFPLDEPGKIEEVWTGTGLTTDNLQISRDGRYLGAQFPWPDVGCGELQSGLHQKFETGCWSSFAPDNSYLLSSFKGTHKELTMTDPVEKKHWKISVGTTPGYKNQPSYHPRWSNDPRFLTMTGPYPPPRKQKDKATGKRVKSKDGVVADVYLGRFSEGMDKIEKWVRITHNSFGDFYPDAWIEGGEKSSLTSFPQSRPWKFSTSQETPWPVDRNEMLYYWSNAGTSDEIVGRHGGCRAIGHGIGRFTRGREMLLDGGWFGTEPGTTEILATALPDATALTIEFLCAESGALPPATMVRLVALEDAAGNPYLEISRTSQELTITSPAGRLGVEALELKVPAAHQGSAAAHLALQIMPQKISFFLAGAEAASLPLATPVNFASLTEARLVFGQGKPVPAGWEARMQNVAVYRRACPVKEIQAMASASKPNAVEAAPQIRLKARLLEATEPDMEMLASYQRMLVDHTYEVVKVLEGNYEAQKIVVLHWAVLDRRPVPGIPREIGEECELTLESMESHPELESELQIIEADDLSATIYMDVATPLNPIPE